jgi:hypothetical protein
MNNEKTNINEEQALQIGSVMLRLFTEQEINAIIDAKEMNNKSPFITRSDEKTLENDRGLVCECLGINV